jgi:glycosyltransferase involved in cell wall biosynthesis
VSSSPGVRVVLDLRPLQDPGRAPVTAIYLDELLSAYDAAPRSGESFAFLLRSDQDDPTVRHAALDVVGRRLVPPTGWLGSAAHTVDPFVLRGASVGAAWRAERSGAGGAVYHAVGSGTLPIGSRLPLVVTLLDLAPWELPALFARTPGMRFGQRLRGQLLRGAAAVIVGTDAVAAAAHKLVHIRSDRIHVVPLAARPAFRPGAADEAADAAQAVEIGPGAEEAARLGLGSRYFVYSGRYDARQDLATLLRSLAALAADGRPADLAPDVPWPPRTLLVGASPDDRAALARAAARQGVGEALAYAPAMEASRLASLVRGARAALLPVLSEGAGFAAIEAIAAGTPVIASAVGALPEIVASAGLLVEPREADRLAVALRTMWLDDRVHARVAAGALARASEERWTWADVARATRAIYAGVGSAGLHRLPT